MQRTTDFASTAHEYYVFRHLICEHVLLV